VGDTVRRNGAVNISKEEEDAPARSQALTRSAWCRWKKDERDLTKLRTSISDCMSMTQPVGFTLRSAWQGRRLACSVTHGDSTLAVRVAGIAIAIGPDDRKTDCSQPTENWELHADRPILIGNAACTFEERFNKVDVQFEETRGLIRLSFEGLDGLRDTTERGFAGVRRENNENRTLLEEAVKHVRGRWSASSGTGILADSGRRCVPEDAARGTVVLK
jgi:hypothetical protein